MPVASLMRLVVPEFRYLVITLFVAVASGQLLFTLLPPRGYPIVYPPYLPPWIQAAGRMLRPNELMISDMPWAVAFVGLHGLAGGLHILDRLGSQARHFSVVPLLQQSRGHEPAACDRVNNGQFQPGDHALCADSACWNIRGTR